MGIYNTNKNGEKRKLLVSYSFWGKNRITLG